MGFGKYEDLSVQNLLIMNKGKYLRWVYYNASHITFFDDILIEIGIHKDIMFDKPGRNEELFKKLSSESLLIFPKDRTDAERNIIRINEKKDYFYQKRSLKARQKKRDGYENSKILNRISYNRGNKRK